MVEKKLLESVFNQLLLDRNNFNQLVTIIKNWFPPLYKSFSQSCHYWLVTTKRNNDWNKIKLKLIKINLYNKFF